MDFMVQMFAFPFNLDIHPMVAGWLASGFWVTSARMPSGWEAAVDGWFFWVKDGRIASTEWSPHPFWEIHENPNYSPTNFGTKKAWHISGFVQISQLVEIFQEHGNWLRLIVASGWYHQMNAFHWIHHQMKPRLKAIKATGTSKWRGEGWTLKFGFPLFL